jgi:two-component system nitrate/nitrite response regulator NarL
MGAARISKRKVRILVADHEGVFRLGLKRLFGVEDDLRLVAQADDPAQVPGLAKKFKPDLCFMQAEMLGADPADFISRVRHAWPGSKIIVTTSVLSSEDASRYVKAGAAGAIAKSVDPALFVKSARRVMRNHLWLPKQRATPVDSSATQTSGQPRRPVDTLTRRERSVIACLIQGWRNREIANYLRITEQTVKNYLRAIYDKVGVSDRLELALYAIHQRLELPPLAAVEPAP